MKKKFVLVSFGLFLIPSILMAHGVSASDQQNLHEGGLMSYVWVGAKHMVTGYDHLLFLAGVIFFLKNFKDILLFINAFTFGHSISH